LIFAGEISTPEDKTRNRDFSSEQLPPTNPLMI